GAKLPPGYLVDKPCVSPGYFRVLGIRLLQGRDFAPHDNQTAPGVVIVSESVARRLWPTQDPLGQRLSMEDRPEAKDWLTVVGIVSDVKQQGLAKNADPAIYQPILQSTQPFFLRHMSFVVKSESARQVLVPAMRSVLREADRQLPAQSILAMDSVVASTIAEPRFQTRLLGTFALLALVLAVVGTYGVLAYSVAQRTREIGVRMALGARPGNVVGMLLRSTLAIAGVGILIGAVGASAAPRLLGNFLF